MKVSYSTKGSVGILTINNPKAHLLDGEVLDGIRTTLDLVTLNSAIRAVCITSEGNEIFSGGADLSRGLDGLSPSDYMKRGQDLFNKIEYYPKPVIAVISGHATGGGCEISMACHFRFMQEGARMGLTETNLGIIPGYGGSLRMPRLVGHSKALEYMLLGTRLEANDAKEAGLVDYVYPADTLMDEALSFAEELAQRPAGSVAALLKIMASRGRISSDMHLQMERDELSALFGTPDMIEGMKAFAEKRKPEFNKG